jgi:hypothetical protein
MMRNVILRLFSVAVDSTKPHSLICSVFLEDWLDLDAARVKISVPTPSPQRLVAQLRITLAGLLLATPHSISSIGRKLIPQAFKDPRFILALPILLLNLLQTSLAGK